MGKEVGSQAGEVIERTGRLDVWQQDQRPRASLSARYFVRDSFCEAAGHPVLLLNSPTTYNLRMSENMSGSAIRLATTNAGLTGSLKV
jgi:hypothetical protein